MIEIWVEDEFIGWFDTHKSIEDLTLDDMRLALGIDADVNLLPVWEEKRIEVCTTNNIHMGTLRYADVMLTDVSLS